MSRDVEQFAEATSKVRDIESHAEGGYLHEYDAVLDETEESVRVITLPPDLADNDAATDAFERVTGQWYNANTHPNIVSIVERESTPQPWIAVDQPHELTLDRVQSQLTPTEIETVVTDTAEALRTLGLYNAVHGTLSPADILVYPDGDDTVVQVGGFGLEHAVQTALGEVRPIPYTAPELLDDQDQATDQTDVYGLGAITYFALTGQSPVEGPDLEQGIRDGPAAPPSEYNDGVGPAIDEALMQALSTRPSDRQDSPHAFKRAFLSAFDPTACETGGDNHAGAAGTDSSSATDDTEQTDGAPVENENQTAPADEVSPQNQDTYNPTRRTAITLLGFGAIGGVAWYLFADPPNPTATDQPPEPPVASISATPTDPTVGQEVTFSAAESTTGDGVSLETYEWGVGADADFSVGDETLTQSFDESGEQMIRLRITDSQNRTATATTTITVEELPAPPSASISVTPTNPTVDEEVTFSAAESTTGEGVSLDTYEWAVGTDAEFSVGDETVTQSFSDSGEQTVRLRITDSQERTATTTTTVTVEPSVEWPMFRHDSANTGTNPAETGPQTSIGEQWSYQPVQGVFSSPSIVNGTVYVGSNDDSVYALLAEDGSERWSYQTGDSVRSSPAVAGSTVYIGSRDASVYALSAEDGTEQWSYQTGGDVYSSPAVVDGTVYIGSWDNNVYALSAEDGTEQWSYETGDRVESSPAVVDGTVYVGSDDNNVYALSADDGSLEWFYEGISWVFSSPAVADGIVYIGSSDNAIYALSAADGTVQWAYETGGGVRSSPAVVDGIVYVGSDDGNVYALSAEDGTEQWSYQTGDDVESSPAVVDGTVYVGSQNGNVYALSAEDGTEQWSYQTSDIVDSSPAVVDGTVYVGSWGDNVYALSEQ